VRIAAVGSAFPPHFYSQDEILAALRQHWAKRHHNLDRLETMFRNVLVGGRHLALPIDEYDGLETWGQANDAWIRVAEETGGRALLDALARAGLSKDDLDVLIFVSVTGIATPSIDARLINRLGLRPDLKRIPIFGLGCVAGAAGIARAADLVRGDPRMVVALLSVELCSLTFQSRDLSVPNLVASGLFGDGAACAIVAGREAPEAPASSKGPEIVASRSIFYPNSERVMGWDISGQGFQIVLSANVPDVVRQHLPGDIDSFLGEHGLTRADIGWWVSHPGGPKVLEAMEEALELPPQALELSWKTLRELGNLSSTSVLLVLREQLETRPPAPGSYGLLLALGPGFCSELVLLRG
jgi:alkylresorcinol/alkylpyrone synthase